MAKRTLTTKYVKDFNAAPKERKHIILMDGTWNDETGRNANMLVTNVVNLKRILVDDNENQIVRYHRGVGNDNDNSMLNQLWKGFDGKDVFRQVDHAYARMVQDWRVGDKICIFGFSRGAAAARLLASKINDQGIPKSITITIEPKENKETKAVEQVIASYEVDRTKTRSEEIEFLGVWDTVSAIGGGRNIKNFFRRGELQDLFRNNEIAGNIQKAVHLVAIDETRNPFAPSLMNDKPGVTLEVWFPGVHSDVGGGYKEDEIAKSSLYFMVQEWNKWCDVRGLQPLMLVKKEYLSRTERSPDKAQFHFKGLGAGESIRTVVVQKDGTADSSKQPIVHELYYELATSKKSYAVVQTKKTTDKENPATISFQYMPFNVKELGGKYATVANERLTMFDE